MPILAMLLAASPLPLDRPSVAPCVPAHLRLSLDARNGEFAGMSHQGTRLSIRNVGPDCTLAALPTVQFRDARGRVLPAARRAPVSMHPGPAMVPVRLAAGHRAEADLRWIAGPVFDRSRSVRAASVSVRLGGTVLRAPLRAQLYGEAGKPVAFEQTPLRAAEGMAAG